MQPLLALDHALFAAINHGLACAPADLFFLVWTEFGNGFVAAALALVVTWRELRRAGRRERLGLLGGVVAAALCNGLLKAGLGRPRPPALAAVLDGGVRVVGEPLWAQSFPSGHTLTAFCVAMVITHVRPRLGPVVFAMAALVGISRIYLGVHFPSDVAAGALLGTLCVWAGLRLAR